MKEARRDHTRSPRVRYTLGFKVEAVRLVEAGLPISEVAPLLGICKATLRNWCSAEREGRFQVRVAQEPRTRRIEPQKLWDGLVRVRAENRRLNRAVEGLSTWHQE